LAKKPATPKVTKLDTLEQVERDMEELARLQRRMDEITAKREYDLAPHVMAAQPHVTKIDEITQEAATELKPLEEQYELLMTRVIASATTATRWQRWVKAAADTVKRLDFPTGGYITRQFSPGKRVHNSKPIGEIVDDLEAKGLIAFFERVPKLKKAALKANPGVVEKIDGLSIVQDVRVEVHPLG
jgi:phage host-nuclease inhibitor protein Gam